MIDKLKTWIKKQTHAERVGKKNTRSKIKDGKAGKMNKKQKQKQKKKKKNKKKKEKKRKEKKRKKKRKENRNKKEIK